MLAVGDKIPEFQALCHPSSGTENTLTSEDLIGKWAVVYFYPKDETPGCTKEACGFGSLESDFKSAGSVILGISTDSIASHRKFAEKYDLPFTLLSDPDHSIAEKFGVWVEKKNYGKSYMGVERSTFVFDPAGTLIKVFTKVRVDNHHNNVLDFVKNATA